MKKEHLEQVVEKVLTHLKESAGTEFKEVGGTPTENSAPVERKGVVLVRGAKMALQDFDADVSLVDYITSRDGASMAAGLMEIRACTFDWELKYEEVDFVLEGTLDIVVGGKTYRGYKGDCIYIPKNTKIKFSTPDRALFFYVTYPADWAAQ